MFGVKGYARNIVDAVSTFRNQTKDLFNPNLRTIVIFQRATTHKTAIINGKNRCLEQRFVSLIKRNIKKNGVLICHCVLSVFD